MSAAHVVLSHADSLIRTAEEKVASPALEPNRVRLREPLETIFRRSAELNTYWSLEKAKVKLPSFFPEVIETRRLDLEPLHDMQATDVSACHVVLSHAVLLKVNADV